MRTKREYRNRDDTQVAVLDALVDRHGDGMTVLELRAHVDADIDDLEAALGELKDDDLIAAERDGRRTVIKVDDRVIEDSADDDPTLLERIRQRLGL